MNKIFSFLVSLMLVVSSAYSQDVYGPIGGGGGGGSTMTFNDNVCLYLGTGDDTCLKYDGTDFLVNTVTGDMTFTPANNEEYNIVGTFTNTSGNRELADILLTFTPSGDSSGAIRTLNIAQTITGAANITGQSQGFLNTILNNNTGTTDEAIGNSTTISNNALGVITEGVGYRCVHNNAGGGTFTDYTCMKFIDSASGATNRYAFYFDPNYLSGTSIKINTSGGTRYIPTSTTAATAVTSRTITVAVSNPNNDLVTGDNQAYFRVPADMNGWILTASACSVSTVSGGAAPTVMVRNSITANDMYSTALTIDATEKDSKDATVPVVINASFDDVSTGDQLAHDVDVAGTGTRGLVCSHTLTAP